jgi:HAD superfamily hydrolase (TIGR01509 family)
MKRYQNYIFDLDGTLIDSTPSHVKAFNYAIEKSSKITDLTFNYEKMKGKRTLDVMLELGFDTNEAQRLTKIKQEAYRDLLANGEVNLFPGVIDCFKLIKENNCGLFICTGASRTSVELILVKFSLDEFVDDFITGTDVDVAKPDPKILNTIIQTNKLEKDKCLFIEDSDNGKECGIKANVKTVIVNNQEIQTKDDFDDLFGFYEKLREVL